jgi:hypothetical protein
MVTSKRNLTFIPTKTRPTPILSSYLSMNMTQEICKKDVHWKRKTLFPNKALKFMLEPILSSCIYEDDTRNLKERCLLEKEDTISKQSFKIYARNPGE